MLAQQMISSQVIGLLGTFINKHQLSAPYCASLGAEKDKEYISYSQWWQALEELYQESGIEYLGLEIGAAIAPKFSGLLGYLGLSSLTLGDAIDQFERYQSLLFQGQRGRIERHVDKYVYHWLPEQGEIKRFSDETLISAIVAFSRQLTGYENLTPLHIGFMHQAPQDTRPYADFFQCKLSFSCGSVFIEIPLGHKLLEAKAGDPALAKILESQAQTLLKKEGKNDESFLSQVKDIILKHEQWSTINQHLVAESLSMSSRNLHRKLAKQGAKFNQLVQELRYQQAQDYLQQEKYSIAEISQKLGYAEQSAFTRAFKKWSGKAPKNFIKH